MWTLLFEEHPKVFSYHLCCRGCGPCREPAGRAGDLFHLSWSVVIKVFMLIWMISKGESGCGSDLFHLSWSIVIKIFMLIWMISESLHLEMEPVVEKEGNGVFLDKFWFKQVPIYQLISINLWKWNHLVAFSSMTEFQPQLSSSKLQLGNFKPGLQ